MSSERPSVLVSGYVALDVIQAAEGTWLRAGGTAANVAANLAYFGWRSSIIGLIGNDDAGPIVVEDLRSAGVDASGLRMRDDVGTPLVLHQVRPSGHRFRFGCPECGRPYRTHRSVSLKEVELVLERTGLADVFFFDRPSSSALEIAGQHHAAGRLVFYEPASAARPRAHQRAVALADVVKYSDERLPNFEHALPEARPGQLWILTAGKNGLHFRVGRRRWRTLPAVALEAVDAGGAGDWMTAALLARLGPTVRWTALGITRALEFAQAVAGLSCLVPGARTLGEALTPGELQLEAKRLVTENAPRVIYSLTRPAGDDGYCRVCRLPVPRIAVSPVG
jgi:fructokinase